MAKGDASAPGTAVNNANNMMQSGSFGINGAGLGAPGQGIRYNPNSGMGGSFNLPNEQAMRFNPSSIGPSQGVWGNMMQAGVGMMPSMVNTMGRQTNTLGNEQAMRMPMNSQQQMSNANPMPSMAPADIQGLIMQYLAGLNGNNQPAARFVPGIGIR